MIVTRTSMISGITRERDIPISQGQYDRITLGNDLIQKIVPNLSLSDREFIINGITDEEWESIFGVDDNEYDEST